MGKAKCPVCGSANAKVNTPEEYPYDQSGLPGVVLVGNGVEITECGDCGSKVTQVKQEQQLLQVIGLMVLVGEAPISGHELSYMRAIFGMSQKEMAEAVRSPRRETISEWEGRDQVCDSPWKEISLRVALVYLFKTKVIDSEFCFLPKDQVKRFKAFMCSFVEIAAEMQQAKTKKKEPATAVTVRRRSGSGGWFGTPIAVGM